MCQRGAVLVSNKAVHNRLRVDEHVEFLRRQGKQKMGLYELEALVHKRGAVDGDFRAHRPIWMRNRLLGRYGLHPLESPFPERPARGSKRDALNLAGIAAIQHLKD